MKLPNVGQNKLWKKLSQTVGLASSQWMGWALQTAPPRPWIPSTGNWLSWCVILTPYETSGCVSGCALVFSFPANMLLCLNWQLVHVNRLQILRTKPVWKADLGKPCNSPRRLQHKDDAMSSSSPSRCFPPTSKIVRRSKLLLTHYCCSLPENILLLTPNSLTQKYVHFIQSTFTRVDTQPFASKGIP